MNAILKSALAVSAISLATHAAAQVTFYQGEDFEGPSFTTQQEVRNFERIGFNDRASSVVVQRNLWEVCEDARFNGRCVVLRPGRYDSLRAMGLNDRVSSVRMVNGNGRINDDRYAPAPVTSQVTFYERENFEGRTLSTENPIGNFERIGFNDRASSIIVVGGPWEVCDDARFGGRCAVLRPGRYPSLRSMGLNDRISSVRTVSANARFPDDRYAPAPVAAYDNQPQNNGYQRRDNERLYEANVTSVRAVVGTPEQRCWIESEQVPQQRSGANVPGAIAGAVIGGILGHQVGEGRGKDFATAGGAIAGGAIGANVGRDNGGVATQNVQRCANVPNQARADYWDVTYDFRGQAHRVQMTTQPGRTVTVNEQGEPRS